MKLKLCSTVIRDITDKKASLSRISLVSRCISNITSSLPPGTNPNGLSLPLSSSPSKISDIWPTSDPSLSYAQHQCKKALSDAEKIVDYSTSQFGLRSHLNEEISNVVTYLRRLVGTNHPLLETAKRLTGSGSSKLQTRGLIILLMSKAAGYKVDPSDTVDAEKSAGISQRQQSLAEMAEMIHSAHLIHRGILNLSSVFVQTVNKGSELHFGNKMSVLSGDYLLATVWKGLGELKNSKVVEMMAQSISDFMEGQFVIETESKYPEDNASLDYWEQRNFRMFGSLQANSCKSALLLAGHDMEMQEKAFQFGKNFALSWQALNEMQIFLNPLPSSSTLLSSPISTNGQNLQQHRLFDLMSAPILLHILSTGNNLNSVRCGVADDGQPIVDYQALHHLVRQGHGIKRTRELKNHFASKALASLQGFPVTDAVSALTNILNTVIKQ